jgi:asparagine synthase (glutamine-hydrolysing)
MERFARHRGRVPFVLRRAGASLLARGGAKLRALILDDYGFAQPYFLTRALFLPEQIAALIERDAVRAIDYGPWAARVRETVKRAEGLDPVNRVSYLEFKTYIANTLLRDADVMSMAHSLEIREPLLDHRLLEDVMRVPGAAKLKSGTLKPLLVSSLPESLPAGVTRGGKRGFTLPFEDWLPGRLRPQVEETLAHPPRELDGVVDPEAARAVWRSFLAGGCSWTRPWSLYVLYKVAARLFDSPDASAAHALGGVAALDVPAVPQPA